MTEPDERRSKTNWLVKNRWDFCDCTMCQWDRMGKGLAVKPRRRPRFATAWIWGVIKRNWISLGEPR